ncbi:hypothetical protein AAHH67_15415 [Niallia circulans]
MIIRINGEEINRKMHREIIDISEYLPKTKKEAKKMKKLATWLWGISGVMMSQSRVFASTTGGMNIWNSMQPLWDVFKDISMVCGTLALFIGVITFLFKRNAGKQVILTSVIVIAGCFLIPSAVMLFAIIGNMLNDVLTEAFQNMNFKDSVKVGG